MLLEQPLRLRVPVDERRAPRQLVVYLACSDLFRTLEQEPADVAPLRRWVDEGVDVSVGGRRPHVDVPEQDSIVFDDEHVVGRVDLLPRRADVFRGHVDRGALLRLRGADHLRDRGGVVQVRVADLQAGINRSRRMPPSRSISVP